MTLEGDKATPTSVTMATPLVGGAEDDSDSDSEAAVDIDEYIEDDDPVSHVICYHGAPLMYVFPTGHPPP